MDCVFILQGIIDLLIADGKKLYTAMVDLEKCYDYLDRSAVFSKLLKEGVSSKCVNIFKEMYSKLKLEVRGEEGGGSFINNSGLIQGSCTSPIFFSLFINDLESYFIGSVGERKIGISIQDILIKFLLFADDLVIMSETEAGLQSGLNRLAEYCDKWGLTVNTKKTKVIVFSKSGRAGFKSNWTYKGQTLERVTNFKYLGYHFSSSGTFSKGTQELTNSARRAMFSLKKIVVRNPSIKPSTQLHIFKSMIEPILCYCSEVWGLSRADPMERLHLSFLRSILHVKSSTPKCFIYGELGQFPLYITRKIRVIKYWLKLIRPDNNNERTKMEYNKIIYNALLELSVTNPNKVTWVTLIRDLLNSIGLGDYWLSQCIENESKFISIFRQRIQDIHYQEWSAEVDGTSSNRLFKYIKEDFKFEEYLDSLNNKAHRICLTQVRLSSHAFMSERGRWGRTKVKYEERKCSVCNVVEDEYHCLIECPRFEYERRYCMTDVMGRRESRSMFEFVKWFKSKGDEECKKLSLLCFKIMREYRESM